MRKLALFLLLFFSVQSSLMANFPWGGYKGGGDAENVDVKQDEFDGALAAGCSNVQECLELLDDNAGSGSVSDTAYAASWDGVTDVAPSKNAVYDKIEALVLGSGSGDVVGPASSIASEIVLFDGTTGKLIKAATGSGLVTATSGVYGTTTNNSSNWDTAHTDRLKWDGGATGLTAATGRTSLGMTANAQSLVTAADYAAMRTLLDLEAGTDFYSIAAADAAFQPLDSDLTTIAGLTATTNNFIVSVASAWASRTPAQVQATLSVDDLITLSGVAEGATHLGTFTGTTITDSSDIKEALQELETAVENVSGGSIDGSGTTNEITYWVDSDTLGALAVATYPSLTELAYVKGVTSAIQTQLNAKQALDATLTALAAYNTNGVLVQTAADTFAGRTIAGTAPISVSNGDGVSGNPTISCTAASDSASGCAELATTAEVTTGTDTGRTVTPDALAGSTFGTKTVQLLIFDFATDTATGDGKHYFPIPEGLDGYNLVGVMGHVKTAGTTGTTDVQIARCVQAATGNICSSGTPDDVLSTKLTIDSGENTSRTAAAAAAINTSNDDVAEGQVYRVDFDAVSTTAAKGYLLTLTFRKP